MKTVNKFNVLGLLSTILLIAACNKAPAETNDQVTSIDTAEKQYIESTPKILTVSEALQAAIDGEHRSDKNHSRDQYRNPAATLEFFGVKPDDTVVELWPGGGWYSEILAPYLRDEGSFYAANFGDVTEPAYRVRLNNALNEKFAANPEIYGTPNISALNPPTQTLLAPSNSADFVLTFRNVHNWLANDTEAAVYQAAFNALKPGGIFGVVEHRGDVTDDPVAQAKTGYVSEAHVISVAESVGFVLAGRSEVNANPKDTKDYEFGVWTLPPSLRKGDEDRDKYMAIGESDRMTLKFQKPE